MTRTRSPEIVNPQLAQGQALVLVALTMTVMLLFAAFAIEMGRFVSERRYLQNMVDSAALAGALEWKDARARGETEAEAEASAEARVLEALRSHFSNDPTGTLPTDPEDPPQFAAGCSDPVCLIDGILVNEPGEPGAVRVAMQNEIPFTFGRLAGLGDQTIGARAFVGPDPGAAGPLPIAVREYIDGNTGGTNPCPAYGSVPSPQEKYRWVFATAPSSCVNDSLGASVDAPGPRIEILGNGADPNNASGGVSFSGFVALDIRDFSTPTSQKFYNGVTPSTNVNTLKQMQAAYFCPGYPGPPFPPITSPADPGLQVGAIDGTQAGISVDALTTCYREDDLVMVLVYGGEVHRIPDFELRWPQGGGPSAKHYEMPIPYGNNKSLRVSSNTWFLGTVEMGTLWDTQDPTHPAVTGSLTDGPVYNPQPVPPSSTGQGTTVNILDITTDDTSAPGIYSFLITGRAQSYSNLWSYLPATLNVGEVTRDFQINGPNPAGCVVAANAGDSLTCSFSISDVGSAFGGSVQFSLQRLLGGSADLLQTFGTPASVNQSRSVTFTPPATQGTYWYAVRATGLNSAGQSVTRQLPFAVVVAPASAPGAGQYVEIKGYAAMRVVCDPYGPQCIPPNTVWAEALTPVVDDPNAPELDILKTVRLLPWDYSP